jgi:transcriptional regulator with XRE-family HTH domain
MNTYLGYPKGSKHVCICSEEENIHDYWRPPSCTPRRHKQLSQGDIEKRTGLLRCYISRVENGHTVPAIETLEKMARRALELPLYQLMYDGDKPPEAPTAITSNSDGPHMRGLRGKEGRYLRKLARLLANMNPDDRKLLLHMVQKMASR